MLTTDFDKLDALFGALGYGISSEDDDLGFTSETLASVKAARENYAEIGRLTEGEIDGHRYIKISGAQVARGHQLKDVVAVEIGDRLAILSL